MENTSYFKITNLFEYRFLDLEWDEKENELRITNLHDHI